MTDQPASPHRPISRAERAKRPQRSRHAATGRAPSPASVWLCASDPTGQTPPWPHWATTLVGEFSAEGDRILVRSLGGYPSLAGEVAALLGTAHALGRHPLALMPSPATAARTRTLLSRQRPATGDHPHPGHDTPAGHPGPPPVTAATPATGPTDRPPPATPPITPSGALPGRRRADSGSAGARVGVGRRRPATEAGPAALVVVLAGPVAAGARPAQPHPIPTAVLAAWAKPLRPGGLMAVLSPPPVGRRHARLRTGSVVSALRARMTSGSPADTGLLETGGDGVVGGLRDAGLTYLQHIVLVHAPTTGDGLDRPREGHHRPHAPFWPVHTDLHLAHTNPLDPAPELFGHTTSHPATRFTTRFEEPVGGHDTPRTAGHRDTQEPR